MEPTTEDAASWLSADGVHWSTGSVDKPKLAPMRAVTPFGSGLVAVSGFNNKGAGTRAASWTSTDGKDWARAPDAPELRTAGMFDVTSDNSAVVAVGTGDCQNEGPVAWHSTDGLAWKIVEVGAHGEGVLQQVASGPSGFLAVGWSGNDEAPGQAWRSEDGTSWGPVPSFPDTFLPRDVVGSSSGYLLVSEFGTVWSSSDGEIWAEEFAPSDGFVQRVAVGPSVAVAFGGIRDGDDSHMAIWTAPANSLP